ncbi:hypothetical protein LKM48_06145 [Limosilactobacillus fermentum]|nr:hypothetical protein [Limosilactobacillus fermentum]
MLTSPIVGVDALAGFAGKQTKKVTGYAWTVEGHLRSNKKAPVIMAGFKSH